MRVRVNNQQTATNYSIYDSPPGVVVYSEDAGLSGTTETITDVSIPDFRNRMSRGEIVMNPMDLYRYNRTPANSTCVLGPHPSWGSRSIRGDALAAREMPAVDPLNVIESVTRHQQMSLVKAYAAMNSSNMLMGELLSDLDKTVGMLRHPFKEGLSLIAKMYKKRRWLLKRFKSMTVLKASANCWLEYRYGWRPIISDASTIFSAVHAKSTAKERRVFRASVRGQAETNQTWNAAPLYGTHSCTVSANFRKEWQASAGIIAEVSNLSTLESVAKTLGLRTQDIPATLWEVVPFSFVVDWFVNIGPWLTAVTPNPDASVLASWVTTVSKYIDTTSGKVSVTIDTPPVTTYTDSIGTSVRTSTLINRSVNPSLPTTPVVKPFRLGRPQAVDAVALIVQQINAKLRGLRH